jgi:lysophospholipase L1-like esterase
VLVIYLGTNDAYWLDPIMVAGSIGRLVKVARAAEAGPDGGAPEVLVVCPPPFGGHELAPAFSEVCDELGCELLDLDGIATYSTIDDIHLDEEGHIAVAAAVEQRLRPMLT